MEKRRYSVDGLGFVEGTTGMGDAWAWGRAAGDTVTVYQGTVPDDVIARYDVAERDVDLLAEGFEDLARSPAPFRRFLAMVEYFDYFGWVNADEYPTEMTPPEADAFMGNQ